MFTLDTNAIIYFLKDDPSAVKTINRIFSRETPVYVSTITEVELFSFPRLTFEEETKIESFLRLTAILPLDSRIARIAAYLRKTHGLKVSDSVIAATSKFTGTPLVTRNLRDFRKISSLTILDF